MNFRLTAEEEMLREEYRQFIRRELTPEVIAEVREGREEGPNTRGFVRKMGRDGWLAPTLPKKIWRP